MENTVLSSNITLAIAHDVIPVFSYTKHGFLPVDSDLIDENSAAAPYVSLYTNIFKLLNDADLSSKSLLEVQCGKGGGLTTSQKYFKLKEAHGTDTNEGEVITAESLLPIGKRTAVFRKRSNPVSLDVYADKTMDYILAIDNENIVKSKDFYVEALRVLKDDGKIIVTGVFTQEEINGFGEILYPDLVAEEVQDWTKNVRDFTAQQAALAESSNNYNWTVNVRRNQVLHMPGNLYMIFVLKRAPA